MIPEKYTLKIIESLSTEQREIRIRELGSLLNSRMEGIENLDEWQTCLYEIIGDLNDCGYSLGPWDYDSEIEIWGGPSYMDQTKEDDLLLRSEFPYGLKLSWKEYDDLIDDQS